MEPTVPPHSRRVAELRRERGWTQVQLAQRAGVNQTTVSQIELGRWPTDVTKARLAAAFDVNPHELFPLAEGAAV